MRFGICLCLVTLALANLGCNGDQGAAGSSGFIETDESVIAAQTTGQIERRMVSEGQLIRIGDTLLTIDRSKLQLQLGSLLAARQMTDAALSTAKLAVQKARRTESFTAAERDRVARLIKSGSATQKQLDQLSFEAEQAALGRRTAEANVSATVAQLEKTDADVALLNRQLEDCVPLSPLNGVVTTTYLSTGEFVVPGKAMIKVAQLDTVWVKVYLPASQFASVKLGDIAAVSTESGGTDYPAAVSWTASESEFVPKNVQTKESRSGLVYAVKVRIPNPSGALKIGQPVYVTIGAKPQV